MGEDWKERKPYRIGLSTWEPFAFAGLWDRWKNPETGEETLSCTILTCPPNEFVEPIHDRMPVILPPERYDQWLDRSLKDVDTLQSLLVPFSADAMTMYACSPLVNKVEKDIPEVIAPT